MGRVGFQRLSQGRGHPVADGCATFSRPPAHLPDQAVRQLDRENRFAFRHRHRGGRILSHPHISMRLAGRDAMSASKPPNHLRGRQVLLQALDGVIHTEDMLGGRCSIQADTYIIPLLSKSSPQMPIPAH